MFLRKNKMKSFVDIHKFLGVNQCIHLNEHAIDVDVGNVTIHNRNEMNNNLFFTIVIKNNKWKKIKSIFSSITKLKIQNST